MVGVSRPPRSLVFLNPLAAHACTTYLRLGCVSEQVEEKPEEDWLTKVDMVNGR